MSESDSYDYTYPYSDEYSSDDYSYSSSICSCNPQVFNRRRFHNIDIPDEYSYEYFDDSYSYDYYYDDYEDYEYSTEQESEEEPSNEVESAIDRLKVMLISSLPKNSTKVYHPRESKKEADNGIFVPRDPKEIHAEHQRIWSRYRFPGDERNRTEYRMSAQIPHHIRSKEHARKFLGLDRQASLNLKST